MRRGKRFMPVVLMGLLLLSGYGKANDSDPLITALGSSEESTSDVVLSEAIESAETKDESVESQDKIKATNTIAGVSIDFDYTRMSGKASNQIALWVENETGEVVKTLFVTDFTAARRGYENREDALSHWVALASPGELTDAEIDAISSATPRTGAQHFVWDLTDDNGQRVPDGRYYIRLEGTLYWSSNVLYTGVIYIGSTALGELEVVSERSEPDNTDNETMIDHVRMTAMGNKQTIIDNTANWLGGLEPSEALKYMKEHYDEGLVIVEVNTDYWKLRTGFKGAMHIPHDQMAKRYDEIPSGVPVILHCGAGVVSVPAYETLKGKRKDIPQLSYIAGHPPVTEFNEWLRENKK